MSRPSARTEERYQRYNRVGMATSINMRWPERETLRDVDSLVVRYTWVFRSIISARETIEPACTFRNGN